MGQASKRRQCPAIGGSITPAECGEARHSRHACPPNCVFNPFALAQYDVLLEHEGRLDATTVRRLFEEDGAAAEAIAQAGRRNPGHGHHAETIARLFFRTAANGRTFAERWQRAGLPGLKNDERVLFLAKMRMRVALLEIHRVTDAQTVEAVDLMDPSIGVLRLVDRSVASQAVRFATLLTWIYPLPHFWRLSGTGIMLPDLGPIDALEAVNACVAHLGGPCPPEASRARWLAENFVRIDDTLAAAALARRRLMFTDMDAQFGAVTYELNSSFKACHQALVAEPAVAPDEVSPDERAGGMTAAMVWFEDALSGTGPTPPGARRVKGRVVLGPKQWRVEALGAARLAGLRECFEARLGSRVRFVAERRDDIGSRMAGDGPAVDLAAVPPRLLEQPVKLALQSSRVPGPPPGVSLDDYSARLKAQMLQELPDAPLPALDGRTPREAAKLPALRPRLLQVMKGHVRLLDEDNLRTGRSDDINWLLRELGLAEIDFPPPPLRPVRPDDDDSLDEADELSAEEDGDLLAGPLPVEPGRPAVPMLTGAPLTFDQALERLEEVMDSLDTAGAGLDELDRSGSTLIDAAGDLAGDRMTDNEFSVLITFLLQAWFALVPFGVLAPGLHFPTMEAAMVAAEDKLRFAGRSPLRSYERLTADCRQPGLLQALVGGVMESQALLPKASRPSPAAVIGMVLTLRVVLDELDQAMRG